MHSKINISDPVVIITPLTKLVKNLSGAGEERPISQHAQLIRYNDLSRGKRQRNKLFRLKSGGSDTSLFQNQQQIPTKHTQSNTVIKPFIVWIHRCGIKDYTKYITVAHCSENLDHSGSELWKTANSPFCATSYRCRYKPGVVWIG